MIPFEQTLQVRDVDQVAHLKTIVDKFQGGCIKLYLHKKKELTSVLEVIGTVSGMPIDIASNLPVINKYQYPFNDKEDVFIEFKFKISLKKESSEILVTSQVNLFHQYFSKRKVMVAIVQFFIQKS